MKLHLLTTGLIAAVLVAGALTPAPAAAEGSLTAVSWGGAYSESQRKAYYEPWMAATGNKLVEEEYDGELGKLKASYARKLVTA